MTGTKLLYQLQFVGTSNKSRSMRKHRRILADILQSKGYSHRDIAKHMGWKSASAAGNKLRGERDWASGELEKMCELAGITVIYLAELSDDLVLTKHPESVTGARMIDELSLAQREQALQYIRSISITKID
jgi:transcriptional regulator with XRE-family HTH domain